MLCGLVAPVNAQIIEKNDKFGSLPGGMGLWEGLCMREYKGSKLGVLLDIRQGVRNWVKLNKYYTEIDPQLCFNSAQRNVYSQPTNFKGMTQNVPLVQNVVSFARINVEDDIDLKIIAEKVQGCRYNKKRFPAVIMRKTKPKSTILVFKSGRMIIIGSESESEAEQAAKRSIKDIAKALNLKLKITEFKVTNIVANADLGWKIDIARLCEEKNVIRNDNFPGVVYKHMESVKSALIFASGKVVFTGAKSKDAIDHAYIELKKKMEKFKKIVAQP